MLVSYLLSPTLVGALCFITVDLRTLPNGAVITATGDEGKYYKITFDLELTFGPELVFRFLCQGKSIGSTTVQYL